MKKIKLFLGLLLSLLILPISVHAASGKITVSAPDKIVSGNKVSVTVTLSSSTAIGSWQMQISYDKSYLQLTSSSAEAGGTVMASSSASGVKSKKYTFTFKALKTGSTKVAVDMYEAYAFSDMSEISLTSGAKTLKIITQEELEASYSKDNNLSALSVEGYEISPEFNKDTLNYKVIVPEGTTSVNIIATPSDSKSSITGSGETNVSEGQNNVNIVVRAENGSEKTYSLVIEVIDANPINVKVDNQNFTVIKLRSNYTCPDLFNESEIDMEGVKIPTCVNEKTKYTLVGLKDEEGNVFSYIYDKGKYTKYNEVIGTSLKIIILDYDGEIPGLKKANSMIDGNTYATNKYENNNDSYVVYGMNVATGKKDFYLYDAINKTFTLYNDDQIKDLMETNRIYMYVVVGFAGALLLALICIVKLSASKKRLVHSQINNNNLVKNEVSEKKVPKKKEIKVEEKKKEVKEVKEKTKEKEKEEKTKKVAEIEENDETETYYLFEKDRKKHSKKK